MKFPYYKQLDSMDCGPSCLRMVAKFYGKNFTLQALRSKAFISKSGVSMLGISDATESIGFRTRGYRLTWEHLRDEVPLIVHWNQKHSIIGNWIGKRWMQVRMKSSFFPTNMKLMISNISRKFFPEKTRLLLVVIDTKLLINRWLKQNIYRILLLI